MENLPNLLYSLAGDGNARKRKRKQKEKKGNQKKWQWSKSYQEINCQTKLSVLSFNLKWKRLWSVFCFFSHDLAELQKRFWDHMISFLLNLTEQTKRRAGLEPKGNKLIIVTIYNEESSWTIFLASPWQIPCDLPNRTKLAFMKVCFGILRWLSPVITFIDIKLLCETSGVIF